MLTIICTIDRGGTDYFAARNAEGSRATYTVVARATVDHRSDYGEHHDATKSTETRSRPPQYDASSQQRPRCIVPED